MTDPRLSSDWVERIRRAAPIGSTITTVSNGKANHIVDVTADGVLVETDRSRAKCTGPRLVPAALILQDWERLTTQGRMTLRETSHRGSFCCALFARFPEVEVISSRPVVLGLRATGGSR